MLSSGSSYVAVLRARAQERIQRRNIQLTREYLELARLRLEVGVANASELYRWQVTLAENQGAWSMRGRSSGKRRSSSTACSIGRRSSRSHRSIFRSTTTGRTMPPTRPDREVHERPLVLRALRDFMVREGLRNSPEARQIEARTRWRSTASRKAARASFGCRSSSSKAASNTTSGATAKAPKCLSPTRFDIPQPDKFGLGRGPLPGDSAFTRWLRALRRCVRRAILVERLGAEFARVEQDIDTGVRTELYSAAAPPGLGRPHPQSRREPREQLGARHRPLPTGQGRHHHLGRRTDAEPRRRPRRGDAVYDYVLALLFVNREAGHFRNLDTDDAKESSRDGSTSSCWPRTPPKSQRLPPRRHHCSSASRLGVSGSPRPR